MEKKNARGKETLLASRKLNLAAWTSSKHVGTHGPHVRVLLVYLSSHSLFPSPISSFSLSLFLRLSSARYQQSLSACFTSRLDARPNDTASFRSKCCDTCLRGVFENRSSLCTTRTAVVIRERERYLGPISTPPTLSAAEMFHKTFQFERFPRRIKYEKKNSDIHINMYASTRMIWNLNHFVSVLYFCSDKNFHSFKFKQRAYSFLSSKPIKNLNSSEREKFALTH